MSDLASYAVTIEWVEKKRLETINVIARSPSDAILIGRRLFKESRTDAAVIEEISATVTGD